MEDARVVCRELGYPDAVSKYTAGGLYDSRYIWTPSDPKIFLSDLACNGSEAGLLSCPATVTWNGSQACTHAEDVGVICSSKRDCLALDI